MLKVHKRIKDINWTMLMSFENADEDESVNGANYSLKF